MENCANCRFWSDKLAQALGGGHVQSICLAMDGPKAGTDTSGRQSCEKWQDAPLGAVDSGSDADPRYGNPYDDMVDPIR